MLKKQLIPNPEMMKMMTKNFSDYLNILKNEGLVLQDNSDEACFCIPVNDVSYNSKSVIPGTLFIAKGANFRQEYLEDALKQGAVGYIAEKSFNLENSGIYGNSVTADNTKVSDISAASDSAAFSDDPAASDRSDSSAVIDGPIPYIIVKDMRKAISRVSAFCFGKTWADGLKLIGITGTKGKSSTACMIKSILDEYKGFETGFSSGIYTYDGKTRNKSMKLTTPETIELHRILDNCVKNETEFLTMEVSSQGLKYDRVLDLDYEICGFTNISEDHISGAEHSDMEDYFTSKLKIFGKSKKAVINSDMDAEYYSRVKAEAEKSCEKVITFGKDKACDYSLLNVTEKPSTIEVEYRDSFGIHKVSVNIGGDYNAYNALLAIAVTRELDVPQETVEEGLRKVVVPGRMEHYALDNNVDVIVDCAHNKLSYEALFGYAKTAYPGRDIGFLFGCVGDKAYNRRKEAAELCDKYADFAVITERDPGKEPVEKICSEIYGNLEHKDKALIQTDRDKAVETILAKAEERGNSVVLLCGCGSDAYVKRGTRLVEFPTDGERVRTYIDRKNTLDEE